MKIECDINFYVKDRKKWSKEISEFLNNIEPQGYEIIAAEPIEKIKVTVVGRRFKCIKESEVEKG